MAEITINGVTYKLKCGMTDCENGLHSFNSNQTLRAKGVEKGCCVNCRSSLVDWERVHKKNENDLDYITSALRLEMIRNLFWSVKEPTPRMITKMQSLSREQVGDMVEKRLLQTLSKPKKDNAFDGRQTPFESENIVHWAQHATGTCCRKCLEEWYGIGVNDNITTSDYSFLKKIVLRYINEKIPR